MIWSSSALALTLSRLLKSKVGKKLVSSGIITHTTTVIFVGMAILVSFLTFKNRQFFSFTALFLILAYSTSIITLLTIKNEWKSKQIFITLIGLFTALIIFLFALDGVLKTIF